MEKNLLWAGVVVICAVLMATARGCELQAQGKMECIKSGKPPLECERLFHD